MAWVVIASVAYRNVPEVQTSRQRKRALTRNVVYPMGSVETRIFDHIAIQRIGTATTCIEPIKLQAFGIPVNDEHSTAQRFHQTKQRMGSNRGINDVHALL